MKRGILVAAVAAVIVFAPAGAKDKGEKKAAKESPVVATVNGEPVTKAEWAAIWKVDQWHAEDLKHEAGFTTKLSGRPYEDFFFREEVVKIRAMAQKYSSDLPQMKHAIDAIYDQVKSGGDFAALAKQYSQDPVTAVQGGSMGHPQEFHELVFPFNRVAFSLKVGEISEPFLSIFGYHILRVDRILPPTPTEGKGKRVEVSHILIRFPSAANPRDEAETLANEAKVEVLDKGMCKKLVSYCPKEG